MTVTLLPAAGRPAQPWKNGGGVTREIAVGPPGADLAGFDWRISTATVAAAGPFSRFPGIDRVLLVLEGALALRIDGEAVQALGPADPPLAFPGDVPVEADLPGGPAADLNIMVRRGAWRAQVRRVEVTGPVSLPADGEVDILVALGRLRIDGLGAPVGVLDAVRFGGALQLAPVSGPAELVLVSLARAAG